MKQKKCAKCIFLTDCKDQCKKVLTRNDLWKTNKFIPHWVDLNEVGKDQFFTNKDIAEYCIDKLLKTIENIEEYVFIEPSAGNGDFYDLLPEPKIGIDKYPLRGDFIKEDFLQFSIEKKKYIVVGNPPFGKRGWLALSFLWKAEAIGAEYIGMILPMSFQSEGKGNPKDRVENMILIHSEVLPKNSFHTPDGKLFHINSLFQIWKRGNKEVERKRTCKEFIDIFSISTSYDRSCGIDKIDKCDVFIQSTFFGELKGFSTSFSEIKYNSGYGIVIKKNKEEILDLLQNTEWKNISNLAGNGCYHISMGIIKKVLTDNGFFD